MATLKIVIENGVDNVLEGFPYQYGQHLCREGTSPLEVELGSWDETTVAQEDFLDGSSKVKEYWVVK